ncbi:uncharacterized protein LOC124255913 isoform X3 [Haliotis rubra]|uniref:uncharacterized protein LOC124255913 isoform X3 n=1 Tax=Haliotis rubra TaxID=36100 RepID=UPI001EE5E2CE|nr:uncharacterized protein LOC124255913 isoform X3 [Haliotis rubra]
MMAVVCTSVLSIGYAFMTMSSLVLDKVSPIRRPLEMRTSLVAMAFLSGVLSCAGHWASASVIVCLTRYPQFATEGVEFTLSCTSTHSGGLISVRWYRNNVEMFHTSSDADVSTSIFNPATTPSESRAVAGRVTVSSSIQQHNVTLRINSTLDQGSVWKCQAGSRSSNNVTVEITDNTEVHSVPNSKSTSWSTTLAAGVGHAGTTTTVPTTPDQTESPKHSGEIIYAVAGSVGGVVAVVVIVIVVFLCTLSKRRENAEEEKQGKEGRFNKDAKRETVVMKDNDLYRQYADKGDDGTEHQVSTEKQEVIVMEDNDVYHGFVKAESQKPAEKQQVPDVYSKVNKVKKSNNTTEVQITLSIEDLYAKPIKPANGRSESSS